MAELAETRITADHMCPACGLPPRPFCPTCLGAGVVTGLQLQIWQTQENARIDAGDA
jgi:ribosomal protein L37AE/L43A